MRRHHAPTQYSLIDVFGESGVENVSMIYQPILQTEVDMYSVIDPQPLVGFSGAFIVSKPPSIGTYEILVSEGRCMIESIYVETEEEVVLSIINPQHYHFYDSDGDILPTSNGEYWLYICGYHNQDVDGDDAQMHIGIVYSKTLAETTYRDNLCIFGAIKVERTGAAITIIETTEQDDDYFGRDKYNPIDGGWVGQGAF